ncbi:hypothetical protein [Massilia sp. BJB1822]|uniref:hypothetical protein n=1 Tax=Massilia sp. BJB1822 TaxID=2744470 RepID=UPI0015945F48|nr:hypothetical protein [Massilia sp. BJB1822]NVD97809.1 hypothetical protein [Massilia sp. BJB1822]
MPYHVMIFKASMEDAPTVDLYLGSAHTVNLYWESAGHEIGLPTISAVTERVDSEAGFSLSGRALTGFKEELVALLKYWGQSHVEYVLSPHHFDVVSAIIATLNDESFDKATLVIC